MYPVMCIQPFRNMLLALVSALLLFHVASAAEPLELYYRAINNLFRGNTGEAIVLYEKAITEEPLILAEMDYGLMDAMIRSYRNAIRRNPEDFFLLYKLGIRYMLAGRIDRAILELETYVNAVCSEESEAVQHAHQLLEELKKQRGKTDTSPSPFAALGLITSDTDSSREDEGTGQSAEQVEIDSSRRRESLEQMLEERTAHLKDMRERQQLYQNLQYSYDQDSELSETFSSLYHLYHNHQNAVSNEINSLQNQLNTLGD